MYLYKQTHNKDMLSVKYVLKAIGVWNCSLFTVLENENVCVSSLRDNCR